MNEITRENFSTAYPKLEQILQTGSFVAIDFEFLGLPQNSPSTTPSILDSPSERFQKNLESVKRYPPCQLGFTVYTEKGDGRSYDVYVYRVNLFKELEGQHQAGISYSSVSFLKRHDFDFNRWIKNGVTYANLSEQNEIRSKLEQGVAESGLFDEAFSLWLESVRINVDFKIACEPDVFNPNVISPDADKEIEIELCKTCKNATNKAVSLSALWNRPLTKLESCAIVYDLTCRFPKIEFRIAKGQKLFLKRANLTETEEKLKSKALNNVMNIISGASSIIQNIAENKIPIIMHNASLDLLYLYQYFIDDLSKDYSECKREIHRMFPIVVDTKYLAIMCTGLVRDHRPGLLGKLGCLRNYVELYGNNNPEDYFSSKVNLLYANEETIERKLISHDASFDSMVAGEIFLKLSHLFIMARNSRSKANTRTSSLPIKQIMYHLRPLVVNKISLPYSISPIMYLVGEDEHPEYSYQFMMKRMVKFSILEWLPCFVRRISSAEEFQLRTIISKAGNPWKCDLRIVENRSRILVATSGHDIYAKTYNLLVANPNYRICDSHWNYKTAKPPRSPSPIRPTSVSILFSLNSFMGHLVPSSANVISMYLAKCCKTVHNNKPFFYFFSFFNFLAMAFLGRKLFFPSTKSIF